MDPEQRYLESLPTIERIAAFVARRNSLNADESAEFVQNVCVKLLEDDYGIIRKFEGRSKFSTYLHVVISRFFSEWRVKQWGKWRPSAEAKRLGKTAITLERLLTRDGFTFEEAVKILTTPSGGQYTVSELEAIYVRLPPHNPRPILISDDASADAVAVEADADDRAQRADRERTARRLTTALDSVVKTMDAEDRVILQLRFWDGCKVPDIARTLHIDPKKLYKRLEKIFDRLRRALEAAGLDRMEIATLLAHGDQEIDLGILPREIGRSGPSHPNGRGSQRRRRRLP